MKINSKPCYLHIIDTTGPGGAETIFTQLAAETQRSGCKTLALIRGPGWVKTELERLGIDVHVVNCKGSFNVKFLMSLISLIRKEKITIIQSHLLGSNVYASLAGWICGVTVFSVFHGFVDISKSEKFRFIKFLAIKCGSKKIIAVTEQIRDMLRGVSILNPDNIVVIANGVDTNIFKPVDRVIKHFEQDQKIKIGCLGNVRKAKNYPLAIKVLAHLVSLGRNVELFIAGDNTNKLTEDCRALAIECGVSERVHFIGFINNASEYLNSLDIYLLSSSSEGHPLALTQAMACGLPIVATRCGIEHVVTDGETALLAENENIQSISEKLIELIESDELREKMFLSSPAAVKAHWSLSSTLMKYMELYKS